MAAISIGSVIVYESNLCQIERGNLCLNFCTVVNVARINKGVIPKGYLDIYADDSVELIGEASP